MKGVGYRAKTRLSKGNLGSHQVKKFELKSVVQSILAKPIKTRKDGFLK